MNVLFSKITFKNDDNIDLTSLTIDVSPGGRVFGPSPVKANATITISPNVTNSTSATLAVENDGDPGNTEMQTFSAPTSAFITSLDVVYSIGHFDGTVTSSAGRLKAIKKPREKKTN
jgi:hypothetical protein